MEETELIRRSQAGDMDAFEALLLRYEKKVYTIAYKYMGDPDDAGDLAQEALLKAWQSIGGFRGDSSFGTWLGRIAANCCLDELRRRRRVQTTSLDDLVELEDGAVQKELASPQETPEEAAIRQETAQYVQSLLGRMREEYRTVLVLRELEGRSYEEIAAELDCSLGTVKSRIFRARAYLKEVILKERAQNEGNEEKALHKDAPRAQAAQAPDGTDDPPDDAQNRRNRARGGQTNSKSTEKGGAQNGGDKR